MKKICVYSDKLDVAGCLLTKARLLGAETTVLTTERAAAQSLAEFGPARVFVVEGKGRPESYAKSIADFLLEQNFDLFLAGSTPIGRELAAGVAAYADAAMISDVGNITADGDGFIADFTLYSGLVCQQERIGALTVLTAGKGLCPAEPSPADCPVTPLALEADSRVKVISAVTVGKTGVDLASAAKVVSIGMGVSEEDLPAVREVADLLGAELACSRNVAEQRQWLPVSRYVGISGVIMQPEIYLALGISGQMQHIYGCRDSKLIVAINKDEKAAIFQAADYGIVGDVQEFLPLLIDALKAQKQ